MKQLLVSLCVFACAAVGCGKETQSESQSTNSSNASGTNVSNASGSNVSNSNTVTCNADKAKAAAYQAKLSAALLRLKLAESALAKAQSEQQNLPDLQQSGPVCQNQLQNQLQNKSQNQVQLEPCLEPVPSVDLAPLLKEAADAKLSLDLLKAEIKKFLASQKCTTSPLW